MNHETFFENFELLVDAPNGVQKLRELILQLAMQGKLVPQYPKDEPTVVLLEKIAAEKDQLIKEKKIKRIRSLPQIDPQQIPYELPYNWEWVRLGDVGHDCGQKKPDTKFTYIDVSAINKEQGVISENVDILEPSEAPSRARKLVSKGSVIYATVRPYLLNIAIIDKQFEPEPIVSTAFAVLHPYSVILSKYLYYYLRSKPFITYVESEMIGMAYPAINDGKLFKGLVPIPPFEEQKRIVAKVDQLMALCDQLEAHQHKKHEQRIILNNAALDKLLTAPTPGEFAQHWQCICDNFDLLYDAPETVGLLRQAILQLAVQGKLVPQDEGDEPASVLLEKIKVSKEGQKQSWNRKSQILSPIELEEISFSPPKNWEWKRLGEITEIVGGVTKGRKLLGRQTAYYPYLRVANVQRGFLNLDVIKEIEIPKEELEKYRLHIGDVLLTEGGDWDKLGRSAIWDGQIQDCIHQNHIFRARPWNIGLRSQWIVLFTNSSIGRQYFENASKKTTNLASINMTQLRNCPFPIPSVDEQDRILKKVNELMALCDELEAGLVQAQTEGGELMEAVVHHVQAG